MTTFEILSVLAASVAAPLPIVVWYLDRTKTRADVFQLERMQKTLEMYKEFKSLKIEIPDFSSQEHESFLAVELSRLLKEVKRKSIVDQVKAALPFFKTSKFRRLFLWFKPASGLILLLQLSFYLLFGNFFVLYSQLVGNVMLSARRGPTWKPETPMNGNTGLAILLCLAFLILAIVVNRIAIKLQVEKLVSDKMAERGLE